MRKSRKSEGAKGSPPKTALLGWGTSPLKPTPGIGEASSAVVFRGRRWQTGQKIGISIGAALAVLERVVGRHLNHHSIYFYTGTKKGNCHTQKKHPGFGPWTPRSEGHHPTCYHTVFLVYIDPEGYVSIRTNICLGKNDQKRKHRPPPGDDTSTATAEAAPGRVGRDEQGEARRANTALNGGFQLELGRLRLKLDLNMTSRWLRRHGQHIYTCIYL